MHMQAEKSIVVIDLIWSNSYHKRMIIQFCGFQFHSFHQIIHDFFPLDREHRQDFIDNFHFFEMLSSPALRVGLFGRIQLFITFGSLQSMIIMSSASIFKFKN